MRQANAKLLLGVHRFVEIIYSVNKTEFEKRQMVRIEHLDYIS